MKCRECKICNGIVCKGEIPGLGGKGNGSTFINNVESFKKYKIVFDVINNEEAIDTSIDFFNEKLSMPVMIAPIAGIANNYGVDMSDLSYNEIMLKASKQLNTLCFIGDGMDIEKSFIQPLNMINRYDGKGVITMKPWVQKGIDLRIDALQTNNFCALAMDIDSAGLPILKNSAIPTELKNTQKLNEIKNLTNKPFIIKGIMTKQSAQKAIESGCDAIIVSNHGGRVLEDCVSTIDVLEEIVEVVNKKCLVFIDSGIRSASDVFKSLALGADGVLIGRPIALQAVKNREQGVIDYLTKINTDLKEIMYMCGCKTIKDINKTMIKKIGG
ncbi:MAG: alpha-hydroxy-acid oxidizing protein [Erysipelotrichaceae bacterium]